LRGLRSESKNARQGIKTVHVGCCHVVAALALSESKNARQGIKTPRPIRRTFRRFWSESKNARQGIKTLVALRHQVHPQPRQNQKMPVRALRHVTVCALLHLWRLIQSESKNVRQGIKTIVCGILPCYRLDCQNQKMPVRALRLESTLFYALSHLSQNQKMPVRALRLLPQSRPRCFPLRSESKNARQGIKTQNIPHCIIDFVIWSESKNARQGIKTTPGYKLDLVHSLSQNQKMPVRALRRI